MTTVVAIGCSLGGLKALRVVLAALPRELPAAVLLVLHRAHSDRSTLGALLAGYCPLEVSEAEDRQPILPGHLIVAPSGYHLLAGEERVSLSVDGPVQHARPSIDVLFRSASELGGRVVGALLTGASDDGARGLLAIYRAGGVTLVQDPAEAESPIAPRAALALCPAHEVLTLDRIGPRIVASCGGRAD